MKPEIGWFLIMNSWSLLFLFSSVARCFSLYLHQVVNTNWFLSECKCMLCNDFNELLHQNAHVFMLNALKADKNLRNLALCMEFPTEFGFEKLIYTLWCVMFVFVYYAFVNLCCKWHSNHKFEHRLKWSILVNLRHMSAKLAMASFGIPLVQHTSGNVNGEKLARL